MFYRFYQHNLVTVYNIYKKCFIPTVHVSKYIECKVIILCWKNAVGINIAVDVGKIDQYYCT